MSIDVQDKRSAAIESVEQLVGLLRAGEMQAGRFRVGIEHEKLAYERGSLAAPGFSAIRRVLLALTRFDWQPLPNDEEPVALERDGYWVSLEPGGQIELSGPPYRSLHQSAALFRAMPRSCHRSASRSGSPSPTWRSGPS